tara:strand:+ start:96 stop:1166 length:1071 start_codon:yes stop_codon:yes gene_type:complete
MLRRIFYNIVSFFIIILIFEIILTFLPVNQGFEFYEVNKNSFIFKAKENRSITQSKYWNFYNPQRIKINNFGFRNDHNYDVKEQNIVSVIGDSYVEAVQVPFAKTFYNILEENIDNKFKVYSFGFSGAPLSQYLKWAEFSVDKFNVSHLVINVVANDFDESLLKYKQSPGFHYFEKCGQNYCNVLVPYKKKKYKAILGKSNLTRYLVSNLQILNISKNISFFFEQFDNKKNTKANKKYFANTSTDNSTQRIKDSKLSVRLFLEKLDLIKLEKKNIILMIDGRFYSSNYDGYFPLMREYFIQESMKKGFKIIDLKKSFDRNYKKNKKKFEFKKDGHWNSLGHSVVGKELYNFFNSNF